MKLFLDDMRYPPDGSWTLARTVAEAVAIISASEIPLEAVSFDYDMGQTCRELHESAWQPIACEHTDGRDLALWMHTHGVRAHQVLIHTQNPAGRRALWAMVPLLLVDPLTAVAPRETVDPTRPPLFVRME
jgi:hypothetical protein